MRIAFSDTTNLNGLLQIVAKKTGTANATTSSYTTAQKAVDINGALVNLLMIGMLSSGKWQADDTNQSGVPTYSFNLVSGTQAYAFTTDSSSPANQILEIQKIRIKNANGQWSDEIYQIDKNNTDVSQFQNITGTPEYFDLVGNNIVFYPTPSYNSTNGVELTISRTPSYFLTSDTTKKAGIPDMFDDYLWLRPTYFYYLENDQQKATGYKVELDKMESAIKKYYSNRNKTNTMVITTEQIDSI